MIPRLPRNILSSPNCLAVVDTGVEIPPFSQRLSASPGIALSPNEPAQVTTLVAAGYKAQSPCLKDGTAQKGHPNCELPQG